MKVIIIVVIAILFCVYVYDYYRVPNDLVVLQSTLDHFKFELLREKQPIVIQDRLPTLENIHNLWFRYNRTTTWNMQNTPVWTRNRYKYLLIQAQQECDVLVTLGNVPLTEDGSPDPAIVTPVGIRLQANQFMILPYKAYWIAAPSEGEVCHFSMLGVHDYISFILP
jgi:hypothetical protein